MPIPSRILLPLAALLAAAVCVVAPAATSSGAAGTCAPAAEWGKNRPDLAAQVITLVNRYRTGRGLRPLGVSASLTASSTWKSMHMADSRYFSHYDPAPPAGRSAYQRAKDCGFRGNTWGENIAWGYTTAQSVVDAWLDSPGHRANIETAAFTSTGVRAASSGGRTYWTQSFGAGASDVTPAASAATPAKTIGGAPAQVGPATGKQLVASVRFVHLGTGQPLTTGDVRCRAEVDGHLLRVLASAFRGTTARCAWSIPGWARGKQLTGAVGVKVGNAAATRTFVRRLV
jgi:uncharacterized protein YkwD